MRALPFRFLAVAALPLVSLLAVLAACGKPLTTPEEPPAGDGGGGGDSAMMSSGMMPCTTAQDCVPDRCTCNNGMVETTGTVCGAGFCQNPAADCNSLCGVGGVKTSEPVPNVIGSPACTAWCAKGLALSCPGKPFCNDVFFCSEDVGECAASKEAYLQCEIDSGTWACNPASEGSGWSVTSSCSKSTDLCVAADAGQD